MFGYNTYDVKFPQSQIWTSAGVGVGLSCHKCLGASESRCVTTVTNSCTGLVSSLTYEGTHRTQWIHAPENIVIISGEKQAFCLGNLPKAMHSQSNKCAYNLLKKFDKKKNITIILPIYHQNILV